VSKVVVFALDFERPSLPVEQLCATFAQVQAQGYTLGVATSWPRQTAIEALKNSGLYPYVDERRLSTHDDVAQAEAQLRLQGDTSALVKTRPYQFLRAADPGYQPGDALPARGSFVVVGDTTSDVVSAHAANALVIAVRAGESTLEAQMLLEQNHPDVLIDDLTNVADTLAWLDDLETIQKLQFTQRDLAELSLQRWFVLHMHLATEQVMLTPKPVSLNSFNGFYRANGEEYFFKTHVEEQGILEEYYHAEMLAEAGYNVVRPLRILHEKGQQMVTYPVVRWPVMFDLMREVETGNSEHATLETLVSAERNEDERLLRMYAGTLAFSSAQEHAQAPIHQLFWHRLTGGRLQHFYANQPVVLPAREGQPGDSTSLTFEDLLRYRWRINGEPVDGDQQTLGALIERAKIVLDPQREAATIIGHGDAHFGNVFLEGQENQRRYLYFDPAFAGRHAAILDIVKPFFHNVFATWMYFAEAVAQDLHIAVTLRGETVEIEHDYVLTPVRQALLDTKVTHLLKPLLALLREQRDLLVDWQEIMQMALMCCPLLTLNLLDTRRLPTSVCWLGLSQVMQMGNYRLMEGLNA
jgi:phosphoglycolate phosphatase-like HAD superfamily hydrolase